MAKQNPPFDIAEAFTTYFNDAQAQRIHKLEQSLPYHSVATVYVASVGMFPSVAHFLANTVKKPDEKWTWDVLTAVAWKDYRKDKGHGFGPRSTYDGILDALQNANYDFKATYKQGWQLWRDWTKGDGWATDDEFELHCLVETNKQYVLLQYLGYVIH